MSGGNYTQQINEIISDTFKKLTLDGRSRVKEDEKKLNSSDLKDKAKPEPFTKENLIRKVIKLLDLEILPEKKFKIWGNWRHVDYRLKNSQGGKFLLEAKPINADLLKKGETGAVNQIKGVFKLAEVKEEYNFGIATDGLKWIFLSGDGEIVERFDLKKDFLRIKKILTGEKKVVSPKQEEEITDKFYQWYEALIHGGAYKDHEGKRRKISEEDCLINNIYDVEEDDKEELAQIIMNRLIFIKFLQSKNIIDFDLLDYLSDLEEDELNIRLKELFFRVFNKPSDERRGVSKKFKDIPYLNGNLFTRTKPEERNEDYYIKYEILVEIIDFLDSFAFVHKESLEERGAIDPKILGYIFERAMTASERKETGAYYTPKEVTKYIAENTVYPTLIEKVNKFLKEEKGYKDSELIDSIDELYEKVSASSLWDIRQEVLLQGFKVVDPACGSGAFLLAVANILWQAYAKISEVRGRRDEYPDIWLKRLILKNNIYGVDINPSAVEIARLRLWLWLMDSYEGGEIEPLPDLEHKIRAGNTLVGFVDVSDLKNKVTGLERWKVGSSLSGLLDKKRDCREKLKSGSGSEKEDARDKLEEVNGALRDILNYKFYKKLLEKDIDISEEELEGMKLFHWSMEFLEVFNPDTSEEGGFDIVIGNPPYVRQEGLTEIKEYLKSFYETYHGRADLYQYFFERSFEILKENGYFSYIVSNKWLRTGYGKPLRKFLSNYRVEQFIDFGDTEVFKGVSTYPSIIVMKKTDVPNREILTAKVDTENYEPLDSYMEKKSYISSQEALGDGAWSFPSIEVMELMDKLKERGEKLRNIIDDTYRGVLTGLNKAFVIEEGKKESIVEEDPNSEELIKPFLTGRNIRRYHIDDSGKYVILIPSGWTKEKSGATNEDSTWSWFNNNYPGIAEHLKPYKEKAKERYDQGEFWWELRSCEYYDKFEEPKIIYGKLATSPRFTLDYGKYYFNDASFMIPKDDKQLLGILNSKLGWFLITQTCTKIQSGYQLIWKYFGDVPIVKKESEKLEELVDRMVGLHKNKEKDEETESKIKEIDNKIDAIVFDLYDLTEEEVEIVLDSLDTPEDEREDIMEKFREIKD